MIVSKLKANGFFALIFSGLLLIGICFAAYVLISVVFLDGHIIPRGTIPPVGAIIFITLLILLLIVIIRSWTLNAFKIKIDTIKKTIHLKNVITQQVRSYNLEDFDGYLDCYAVTYKGGRYKFLYLVKNKKADKIITGFYYANIDELQEGISSIKYLGFQKAFSKIAIRAFLSRPIIVD